MKLYNNSVKKKGKQKKKDMDIDSSDLYEEVKDIIGNEKIQDNFDKLKDFIKKLYIKQEKKKI